MKKLLLFFLNRDYYILIYAVVSIMWHLPMLGWLIDPLSKICFIWGAFLILWDLLTKRRTFKSINWALPVLMIAFYCITILLNIKFNFYMNIKHLVYLGISLIILYGQDREREPQQLKKLLYNLNRCIIIITLCTATVSLVMFILGISFHFGESQFRQGFMENRLFGVYTSPNTGALYSVFSVVAMLINSVIKNGKIKFSLLYIINGIVQLVYFSLTLSKGGLLTAIAFVAVFVLTYVFPKFMEKRKRFATTLLSLVVCVTMISSLYGAMLGIRAVMSYVPGLVSEAIDIDISESDVDDNDKVSTEEDGKVEFDRIENSERPDNGRFEIWMGGLKAFAQHPLFGYGDFKVSEGQTTRFDQSGFGKWEKIWMYKHEGNLHNIYVQVLTDSGFVGFVLFVVFAFLIAKKLTLYLIKSKKNTENYRIIALLFSIMGAMVANGLVESHLLYNRQDPFGIIFWVYTGIALVLAEKYRGSDSQEKFVFVADTPLQVLNSIRFVCENQENSAGISDMYIYHQFKNSREISERLKKGCLFNNVYDIEPYKLYKGFVRKPVTLFRILLPKLAIKKSAKQKIPLDDKAYETICLCCPTQFITGLHMVYPEARTLLIEDGTGSYLGDIVGDNETGLFKAIDRLIFGGKLGVKPEKIYLSNPELAEGTVSYEKGLLKPISADTMTKVKSIFGYIENDLYLAHRVVYLTQPLDARPGYMPENDSLVMKFVAEVFGETYIARVHPRQSDMDFSGLSKDTVCNLWELECINGINGEKILIGAFSTAQFMPKILTGAEPYVICTYKLLFNDLSDPFWQNAQDFVESFKKMYKNPNRIIVPETFEEFETVLRSL